MRGAAQSLFAALGAALVATVPAAAGPVGATVTISKVTFTGTPAAPVITITGSGFSTRPAADPAISPAKAGAKYHSACDTQPLQGNHKDGHDYGPTALGVGWGTSVPSGYSAGVYVPGSYIDCIGLLVTTYSPKKVVLHLGCQYTLYTPIARGDHYLVQVAGVTKAGVVAYS